MLVYDRLDQLRKAVSDAPYKIKDGGKAAEMFADFLDDKREVGTGRVRFVSGDVQPAVIAGGQWP